jgi:hypothetical protein
VLKISPEVTTTKNENRRITITDAANTTVRKTWL